MMRLACMVLVAMALLFGSREAAAQTCTASAPDLYLGNLASTASTVELSRSMTVECSGALPSSTLRICIDLSPVGGAGVMYLGGSSASPESIDYTIHADSPRTQRWSEVYVVINADNIGSTTIPLYVEATLQGQPAAGRYSSGPYKLNGRITANNGNCSSNSGSQGIFNEPTFDVSAYVDGACEIAVTQLLDFGGVPGAITAAIDSSISLQAECSSQLPYTVALDDGQHASGTQRRMRSAAGDMVDYGLFQDVARSQPWGDGTPEPVRPDTGSGVIQTLTIYGRVPGGQAVPSGTYKDTVTATIIY